MKWDKYFSMAVSGLGICINYLWGGLDTMLTALIAIMVLDFLAGVLCGGKAKKLDSGVAYTGITRKKMMILIMVAVAVVFDTIAGTNGIARSATIFFYISMEFLSVTENAGKLGFPIPDKLKDMFDQLKDVDE